MDSKRRFVSIKEASQRTGYSASYIRLLCWQGALGPAAYQSCNTWIIDMSILPLYLGNKGEK